MIFNKLLSFLFLLLVAVTDARPLVRHIRSSHEFDRLLSKHAKDTGLPVIVDFYSDGCGPCRMMAPIFKKLAKEIGQDKAVFVKVDTNAQHELSSKYQIRSLPTFVFFLNGKKVNQFSGAGEQQLRQMTSSVVRDAEMQNTKLTLESLTVFYQEVDPSKSTTDVQSVYQKCASMMGSSDECIGAAANQLGRRLKQKYKEAPKMEERFSADARAPGEDIKKESSSSGSTKTRGGSSNKPNLNLATKEQLMQELEARLDVERDQEVEEEDDDEDEALHSYVPSEFPEKVVIIGGGPAGMSAAIYAARANLRPVVICPPMGGQLQGKGVDVENYPGLHNMTGPGVVAAMRQQAAEFGAVFESDMVEAINASTRPIKVITMNSTVIETHSVIIASGAESNWLDIPGEYEMRGNGVSSCATCDGAIFRGKDVVVVGGGDSAMEEALVLARTSKAVTLIHRRDSFRASNILRQRVLDHPVITVKWNTIVLEVLGEAMEQEGENVNLDEQVKQVTAVKVKDVETNEMTEIPTRALFVAIGHTPTTQFLKGVVEFDPQHPGYISATGRSTHTSEPGVFAAGDVSDAVYRQAITSAGSGAAAALDAERYLSENNLGNEAAELEAELLAEIMGDGPDEAITYNAYSDVGGRGAGVKESISTEL
mmetsp:Transcript_6925/g.10098  ORF Transcript_6925/g.10098 Transcript_6925/m.10098 type:complete len:653 (+) Transcript_6925:80-2038(+)|eukprot:CAMPEP_0194208044 /NCGR_PEP_ID=MMETSP0156-20130528/6610_1 /TAXON_ID=33649 /ORGANISM="Thalassionema nitzschioides, Strain L26-B" /LENGTH=652 /DNA_ID=CAMNT_0038934929 /DNA_START=58 /DNA_END=2016 /DNA_ORIENTATION=-